MIVSIIVAIAENNVIGSKGKIPWHLPVDMKHFKETTLGHHVIMGQKTYESIGRPLSNRTNIILTFDQNFKAPGCIVAYSLEETLRIASEAKEKEVFIIGGASVYKQAIGIADKIYLTKVHADIEGDAFFPEINSKEWIEVPSEKHTKDENNLYDFDFIILTKK